MRSVGGLSGSPVFIHEAPRTHNILGVRFSAFRPEPSFWLLGMIQGHYDYPRLPHDPERVNMGMAVVTPIEKVLETIARFEG